MFSVHQQVRYHAKAAQFSWLNCNKTHCSLEPHILSSCLSACGTGWRETRNWFRYYCV